MSQCHQLDAFSDGELPESEAGEFCDHLAVCVTCQDGLHTLMQLSSLSFQATGLPSTSEQVNQDQLEQQLVTPLFPSRTRRWVVASVLASAAAVLLFFATRSSSVRAPSHGDVSIATHLNSTRAHEGRFGWQGLDVHRPYDVMRSSATGLTEDIPPSVIASLESHGDMHGVAAAYLLVGSLKQARRELETLTSPTAQIDQALLELTQGQPGRALTVLEQVPSTTKQPSRLWNRALALRDLHLPLLAAEAFEQVAAFQEPGWSAEAKQRAAALRTLVAEPAKRWDRALSTGFQFALGGEIPTTDTVTSAPGLLRLYFYDALRMASSEQRLEALLPVAATLDTIYGGTTLRTWLETSKTQLSLRRPLQDRYRLLLQGTTLGNQEREQFLIDAKEIGDPLMLMGVLVHTAQDRLDTDSLILFGRLAQSTSDSWFVLLAAEQQASALLAVNDFIGVHRVLEPLWARCQQQPAIDYRCLRLESIAATAYSAFHQLDAARKMIESGWQRTRTIGVTPYELRFLQQLANLSSISDQLSGSGHVLARAYLQEALRRPNNCHGEIYSHTILAELLINQKNTEEARGHTAAIQKLRSDCEFSMTFGFALILAQTGELKDEVNELRSESLSLGLTAFADHIEGRALLSHDRNQGQRLLRQAIQVANTVAVPNVATIKARAYSFSVLALDAGKHGEFDRVLPLLAEELGASSPTGCALGIVEEEPLVVVASGRQGQIVGTYQTHREQHESSLVTHKMLELLQDCDTVEVFARPPHFGTPRLLPPNIAWYYRFGGEDRVPIGTSQTLVVSDVEAPTELGLPVLQAQLEHSDVHMKGAEATPSRVLRAMTSATRIELQVHGMTGVGDGAAILVLSPEADSSFALTAEAIRSQKLLGSPLVFLAACHGGISGALLHERRSLVTAFLDAGASAVIASSAAIPDATAGGFFQAVAKRIATGSTVESAVRDERVARSQAGKPVWLDDLAVFK